MSETVPEKVKKPKRQSRADRWSEACSTARTAVESLQSALEELKAVQEEYQEWLDNLPENMQGSAMGEKLEAVCGLSIDGAADEVSSLVEEAEGAELPLGFGRD
jgi:DNA repair exonuclease SbcCD ATPase subunit